MNSNFKIAFLLILTSCEQKSSDNKPLTLKESSPPKTANLKQDTNSYSNVKKHQTFNEIIDTLPNVLKVFIPNGYSVINFSVGDANLDGLTDEIFVLRKSTEETTSNYAEDKPERRPMLLLLGQKKIRHINLKKGTTMLFIALIAEVSLVTRL